MGGWIGGRMDQSGRMESQTREIENVVVEKSARGGPEIWSPPRTLGSSSSGHSPHHPRLHCLHRLHRLRGLRRIHCLHRLRRLRPPRID